jgi:hypothetical protein
MQEASLFVTLAEIAGVFVGFGALIAVRSGGPSDKEEVTAIRGVLSFGIWVMVASLAPVVIGGYDISERTLWLVCGLVVLVLLLGSVTAQGRTLEHRAEKAMATRRDYVLALVLFWPFVLVIAGALVLVVLGPFPDREPALYLTAVVFGLFVAATMLFSLVFSQGRPPQTDRSEPVAE